MVTPEPAGAGELNVLSNVTSRLSALESKDQISDAILRLCRGVDRCDVQLICSCYHDGAYEEHGYFNGDAKEFAELLATTKSETVEFMGHYISNILIELKSDNAARCESCFIAYQKAKDATDAQIVAGRYLDKFEKRAGEWKITERKVIHDWSWREDLSGRDCQLPVHLFAQGRRDRLDPSYG